MKIQNIQLSKILFEAKTRHVRIAYSARASSRLRFFDFFFLDTESEDASSISEGNDSQKENRFASIKDTFDMWN